MLLPNRGDAMLPTRDIMAADPIARWRTGVGNSSALNRYTLVKANVIAPLAIVDSVVNKAVMSEMF